MKNIKKFIPIALLSAAFVVACNPGGGKSEKTLNTIEVAIKDPTKQYYFGDVLNKSDFTVTGKYSDGSTAELKDTEYKMYEMGREIKEITSFPYALSYSGPLDAITPKNFGFSINNGEHFKTINDFYVNKKYNFEVGNGFTNYLTVYKDETSIDFDNQLLLNGEKVKNVTYSITQIDGLSIDTQTGVVTYNKEGAFPERAVVSAYVNDICVDNYSLFPFEHSIAGMNFSGSAIYLASGEDRETYDPNGNGKLYFPSFWNDQVINAISADTGSMNFSGCKKITYVEIPESIKRIQGNAFYGCTGLSSKIKIPSQITYIAKNAFHFCSHEDLSFEFEDCNNWYYQYDGKTNPIRADYLENPDNTKKLLVEYTGVSLLHDVL